MIGQILNLGVFQLYCSKSNTITKYGIGHWNYEIQGALLLNRLFALPYLMGVARDVKWCPLAKLCGHGE